MPSLYEFLNGTERAAWVKYEGADLFVRRGSYRMLKGRPQRTFDLANISVPEGKQGNGTFKRALKLVVEFLAANQDTPDISSIVLVENVMNAKFGNYFYIHEWNQDPPIGLNERFAPPSYWKTVADLMHEVKGYA